MYLNFQWFPDTDVTSCHEQFRINAWNIKKENPNIPTDEKRLIKKYKQIICYCKITENINTLSWIKINQLLLLYLHTTFNS